MTEIRDAFSEGKALITFITCGDPDLETTAEIIRSLAAGGADLIELGIPFSDPTAEGPVIQEANVRALRGGVTTDKIFGMVKDVRKDVRVPMVFMTYANVVFSYGTDRFLKKCSEIGIRGLILPDVPYEEKEDFLPSCRKYGIDLISMIAPTSGDRIPMISKEAEGFLYVVSSMGVTGTRAEIKTDIGSMIASVRKSTDIPCAVGFGISDPVQAKEMSAYADGVIIGSALVKIAARYGRESPAHTEEFVRSVKNAIRSRSYRGFLRASDQHIQEQRASDYRSQNPYGNAGGTEDSAQAVADHQKHSAERGRGREQESVVGSRQNPYHLRRHQSHEPDDSGEAYRDGGHERDDHQTDDPRLPRIRPHGDRGLVSHGQKIKIRSVTVKQHRAYGDRRSDYNNFGQRALAQRSHLPKVEFLHLLGRGDDLQHLGQRAEHVHYADSDEDHGRRRYLLEYGHSENQERRDKGENESVGHQSEISAQGQHAYPHYYENGCAHRRPRRYACGVRVGKRVVKHALHHGSGDGKPGSDYHRHKPPGDPLGEDDPLGDGIRGAVREIIADYLQSLDQIYVVFSYSDGEKRHESGDGREKNG